MGVTYPKTFCSGSSPLHAPAGATAVGAEQKVKGADKNMTSTLALFCALGLADPAFAQSSGDTAEGASSGGGTDSPCLISFDVSDDDGSGTVSRDE